MLQFWKKSSQKEKRNLMSSSSPRKTSSSGVKSTGDEMCVGERAGTAVGPLSSFTDEELVEPISECGCYVKYASNSSQLSKSLDDVLSDKKALSYFIQYMQALDALSLIRFWLEVKKFRARFCDNSVSMSGGHVTYEQLECDYSSDCEYKLMPSRSDADKTVESYSSNSSSLSYLEDGKLPESEDLQNNFESNLSSPISFHMNQNSTINSVECSKVGNGSPSRDSALGNAVRIYRLYLGRVARYPVSVPEELRISIAEHICNVQDGLVKHDCFSAAQSFVYNTMERDYFNGFLQSAFYCRHQVDVLTSGGVTLADIIFNETALFYFTEFLEQEGLQCLLEFLLVALNFQQQQLESSNSSCKPSDIQNDAIGIYNRYFSLQATCPLGFKDDVRFDVEHNICRDGGLPSPDCFQKPVHIILHILEKNYFQPFVTSQLYFKYLSELINTIDASPPPLLTRNRKTGSECSSEVTISTQNTLLAMEDPLPSRRYLRNIYSRDMRIDSWQLYDPDALWKSRRQSGLNFGRINELGRFITDVEPEPDKKSESRITKAVKKLVSMEKDKAKEEIAWQIAEKIVRDITSVTLNNEDDDDDIR